MRTEEVQRKTVSQCSCDLNKDICKVIKTHTGSAMYGGGKFDLIPKFWYFGHEETDMFSCPSDAAVSLPLSPVDDKISECEESVVVFSLSYNGSHLWSITFLQTFSIKARKSIMVNSSRLSRQNKQNRAVMQATVKK